MHFRFYWSNLLIAICFCISVFCNTLGAEHKQGEIIVRYTDDTTDFEKNKTAAQLDLTFKKAFKLTNSALYSFDANQSLGDLKKKLEKLDCVKYITSNKIYRKQSLDPDFSKQWYLENAGQTVNFSPGTQDIDIGWKEAMSRYVRQTDTYVAVMDSGFAKDHQELSNRLLSTTLEVQGIFGVDDDGNGYVDDSEGWDFIDDDNDPYDFKGHGTQVAGIISSNQDGVGVQGISPDAHIKPLRVLNRDGSGSTAALAAALEYIYHKSSFRIVNLSLGGPNYDPLVDEIIKIFEKDDWVLMICASGNGEPDYIGDNNDQFPIYPASYDSNIIVSVGAINQSGDLSYFSNYGNESVDIAAPGENIRVITIEREPRTVTNADGIGWEEQFHWVDSISRSWSRNLYGSTNWMESPRSYTDTSKLQTPVIRLTGMKDPRLELSVDYSLLATETMYLQLTDDLESYKTLKPFPSSVASGVKIISIDISEYAGGNLWVRFSYYPKSSTSFFDIGPMEVSDVVTSWNGFPYYEFQVGTSFAAPIVSGVAALVMSHRPDLLASDVKEILMNSVQTLNSLSGKIKSGGMVRADNALQLADTYKRRSSVQFLTTESQSISEDLKVKVQGIFLTSRELTAGTLQGDGDYFEGDLITIQAFPEPGFIFEGWEQNGNIISTSETYTFTSEFKNYTFKARFLEDLSDPDNDLLPNYAEAFYGSNINNPNSDGDVLSDYEEWYVSWFAPSLNLLEDDTSTITFLEEIIGKDSYNSGELAGIEKGQLSVTSNPSAYNLVTQSAYDEIMNDLMSISNVDTTPYSEGWFYLPNQGWLWTNHSTYPYFFDNASEGWMYFQSGNEKPMYFHYGTKEWMTIE